MKILALTIGGHTINGVAGMPTGGTAETFWTISDFTGIFVLAGIIIALFFLVWGGISWITSGGDKQKINQARDKIFYAIIGLTIIFLSFFVINSIYYFFKLRTTSGGGGGRRASIEQRHFLKSASNWGIDKQKKTLYI